MKKLPLLSVLFLLCLGSAGWAQTLPANFRGFIGYQAGTVGGVGHGQSIGIFDAGGNYYRLYGELRTAGAPTAYAGLQTPTIPFTYQIVDATHATLTVSATTARALTFSAPNLATSSDFQSTVEYIELSTREEMVNTSARTFVSSGRASIVGFVISGTRSRWALIRAVGPGLRNFGVTAALGDPSMELFDGVNNRLATTASWRTSEVPQSALTGVMNFIGAFPLTTDSDDAVLLVRLTPGSYSAVVRSAGGTGQGDVLTEVYVLP